MSVRSTLVAVALGLLVFAAALGAVRPGLQELGTPAASLDRETRVAVGRGYAVMPPVLLPELATVPESGSRGLVATARSKDDVDEAAPDPQDEVPAPSTPAALPSGPPTGDLTPAPGQPPPAGDDSWRSPSRSPAPRERPTDDREARQPPAAPEPSDQPRRPDTPAAPAPADPAPPPPAPKQPAPATPVPAERDGERPPWGRSVAAGNPDPDRLGPANDRNHSVPPGHDRDKNVSATAESRPEKPSSSASDAARGGSAGSSGSAPANGHGAIAPAERGAGNRGGR